MNFDPAAVLGGFFAFDIENEDEIYLTLPPDRSTIGLHASFLIRNCRALMSISLADEGARGCVAPDLMR